MKSKKSILFVLVFCLVLLVSLLFVACNKNKKDSEPTPAPTPAHTHTWATVWSKDATNHWYACSGCSEKKDQAAHVYTDDSDATCNVCGYERTIGHTHTWASGWTKDATKHWHECSGCAEKNEEAVHEYTDDLDTTCNVCGYVRTLAHTHSWASEWSKNDTKHWHACSGCDEKNNEAAHIYDNDHDTTCNTCGYTRSLGDHAAATAWTKDATKHWHACTHDGCELKYNEGEHSIQSGWTNDENGHWHACDVCDLKDNYADHIYDDAHDTTCNTCGYVREIAADHVAATAWTTNETHHWKACTHDGCSIIFNEGEHEYDDIHDTTCNTCGYVRSIGDHVAATLWNKNADGHWHDCQHDGCELKFDYEEHTGDAHGFCTVCAIYMGEDMSINHTTDNGLLEFGTLEAGTYYYKLRNIASGDYQTTGTNLPSGSYVYYTRKKSNGDWQSHGDGTVMFNRGPIYTYDGEVYLVITLTEEVADCYINYCTHGSV